MRYSLWSHDCLVAHTELDIACVTDHLRQGFLEPTPQGRRALVDATGVVRICATRPSSRCDRSTETAYLAAFMHACERREALKFVLRDEDGEEFEHDFIRVWDLQNAPYERRVDDSDEDTQEIDAELLAEFEELLTLNAESEQYGSTWPPRDERWDTMPYLIQVYLRRPETSWEEDLAF